MTLMLVMMFSCLGIGLFARRFGAREQFAVARLAGFLGCSASEQWSSRS